jgi:hypothetical protein
MQDRLARLGCCPWTISLPATRPAALSSADLADRLIPVADIGDGYCSHWTRPALRSTGKAGRKSAAWDRALRGSELVGGALASLCRILAEGRIVASGRLVRGARPMCCFTDVPLHEFPGRRTFRPHLGRWDFEPYGIAVRRDVLRRLGGRPVSYRRKMSLKSVRAAEQAWSVPGDSTHRWQEEREWRFGGDFDLRQLSPDEAIVFVPSDTDAAIAGALSRWPLTILPPAEK